MKNEGISRNKIRVFVWFEVFFSFILRVINKLLIRKYIKEYIKINLFVKIDYFVLSFIDG